MSELTKPSQRLNHLIRNVLKVSAIVFKERTGFTYNYISQMRNGHQPVTLTAVTKIAKAYPGVNPDWLLEGTGKPMKETDSTHQSHAIQPQQVNESAASHVTAKRIALEDAPQVLYELILEIEVLKKEVKRQGKEIARLKTEGEKGRTKA